MNDTFISDLIEDLDHMKQLLERCIRKLQEQTTQPVSNKTVEMPSNIKTHIDQKRKAIMEQVGQLRAQALQTANKARTDSTLPAGIPGMPGTIDVESLRRKIKTQSTVIQPIESVTTESDNTQSSGESKEQKEKKNG